MVLLKSLFSFKFSETDLQPLMEFQNIVRNDMVLRNFSQLALLNETLMRMMESRQRASVLALAVGPPASRNRPAEPRLSPGEAEATKKAETTKKAEATKNYAARLEATKTYIISYYNPQAGKTEVLETQSIACMKDDARQTVEETLGMQSLYPLYVFIAAPVMRQEIVPWRLEQILDQHEYGTPPPASPGGGVIPVRRIAQTQAEVTAAKKDVVTVKAAVAGSMVLKEKAGLAVGDEIMVLEEAVKALRAGETVDKALARLPPLTRARFTAAVRNKRLGTQAVVELLLSDASFLKTVKKKLQTFGLGDLATLVRMLRGLRKKK